MSRTETLTAIVLAWSLACIDLIHALPRAPAIGTEFAGIAGPWAATATLTGLAFAGGWFFLGILRRLLRLSALSWFASWWVFVFAAFALLSSQGFFRMNLLEPASRGAVLISIAFAATLGHAGYVLFGKLHPSRATWQGAWKLFLALPLVLSIFLVHRWATYHVYDIHDPAAWSYRDIIMLAACGLALVVTYFLSVRTTTFLLIAIFAGTLATGGYLAARWDGFVKVSSPELREARNKIPRIILIVIDTLRADALSFHNPDAPATPNIDKLAAESIVFRNAYSGGPWTLPGMASILTGLPEFAHEVNQHKLDITALPVEIPTLAGHLRDAGYATAAIVENSVLDPDLNVYQGFHQYIHVPQPIGQSFGLVALRRVFPRKYGIRGGAMLTEAAQQWLADNRNSDSFLWLHYFEPHIPYEPPARLLPRSRPRIRGSAGNIEFSFGSKFELSPEVREGYPITAAERSWIRQLYLGEVRYADENVGVLLDFLRRTGLYDDSLIILTSDHGEEFWEHGGFEHGHALYDEVIGVPLIVKLPQSSAKSTVSQRVSTQLIMPTVLDLAGLTVTGRCYSPPSLVPLWTGSAGGDGLEIVLSSGALYYEDQEAILLDNHKLIRYRVSNREELYDLGRDAGEKVSILGSAPEMADRMRRLLDEKRRLFSGVRDCYSPGPRKRPRLSPEQLRRLRELGYLR